MRLNKLLSKFMIATTLLLLGSNFQTTAQTMMSIPEHASNYSPLVRGYWFIAPTDFTITGLRVPAEAGTGAQSLQVIKIHSGGVAEWNTLGTNFTTLFYINYAPNFTIQATDIDVSAGDTIGIFGQAGTTTSQTANAQGFSTTIGGLTTELTHLLYQGSIDNNEAPEYSSVYSSAVYGRIEMFYAVDSCNGQPTAGTISSSIAVCPSIPFNITATGATESGGMENKWQESPAGQNSWTDIPGAIVSPTYSSLGITDATDYRYITTCTSSGLSDTSDVVSAVIDIPNNCHCIPEGTHTNRYIDNFSTTGGIQNISNLSSGFSSGGYGDFSSMVVSQEISETINFSVDIHGGTAGFRIWVDWNQNGIFESSEVVFNSTSWSSTHTGSFNIPTTALGGETRMRIASHWGNQFGDVPPCQTAFNHGEFEDYTIIVDGLCTDPIINLGNDTTICEGESITLDAENTGATYEWNDNSTGQTLEVSTSGTYIVTVTEDDCSTTDSIIITVQDLPIVDLGGDVSICEGESITLDAENTGATYEWNDNSTDQTLEVSDEGTHYVIVTEGSCSASDTVEVNYLDAPTADGIIVNDQDDCLFTFSVDNPENANHFEWDFGDGSPTTNGATANHTYTNNGTYTVTLTIANECEDTISFTHELDCSSVGIKDIITDKSAISIYPNPTKDLLTIESENHLTIEQVTVYNVLGQSLYQDAPKNNSKHTLNVTKMTSGVYTIHIQTNNGIIIRKFEIIK